MKKINKKIPRKVSTFKKTDNKRLAAYALLAFFVFVFIGSVLGIIAFFRTNKKESAFNVVSANADVITDIANQGSINQANLFIGDFFYGESSDVEIYDYMNFGSPWIGINIAAPYFVEYNTLFPLDFVYDAYTEGGEVFIAFELLGPYRDIDLAPNFRISTVNEYEAGNYETVTSLYFSKKLDGLNVIYFGVYEFDILGGDVQSFLEMEIYDTDITSFEGYNFNIMNFQVKEDNYFYSAPAYTYNELVDRYQAALQDKYNEGLVDNEESYNLGYNMAIKDVAYSINGIFDRSTWDIVVNTVTYDDITYNGFSINDFSNMSLVNGSNSVDYTQSMKNVFESFEKDFYAYRYNGIRFVAFDFGEVIPDLMHLTLSFGSSVTEEKVNSSFNCYFVDSNNLSYWATYSKLNDFTYDISFDFSSLPAGAVLSSFHFASTVGNFFATQVTIYDNGSDYSLGFDLGFDDGYNSALSNYDKELQLKYEQGIKYGKEVAYNEGFNAGVENANKYTFTALLSSAIDVPIRAFTSLFNFDLLGINLANFFFALLTMCIVLAVIKLII